MNSNTRAARGRAMGLACLVLSGGASAATWLDPTGTVVVNWNSAALAEVRASRLSPPAVARALAVAHTCMYDAWTSYDSRAIGAVVNTVRQPLAEFTVANKNKAVSYAAHRCLINLFPAGAARLDAAMRALGFDPADNGSSAITPQSIGIAAAAAVINSRRHDGSNQYGDLATGAYADYTGYVPTNPPMPFCLPTTAGPCALNIADPYHWQPLINDMGVTQRSASPHWGRVTPFALTSVNQFDALPEVASGPKYLQSAALYQADIDQILNISSTLTPAQKLSVEYWADGPASELPPGHWSLFAQFVSKRSLHSIDQDVKMFFAMHNASFDAGILAWHLKRKYNGVRPITGVRYTKQGQSVLAWGGPGRPIEAIDGGKWSPYNPGSNLTPAFAGYVSGHSTFSAASATVLRSFTGSDTFGFLTSVAPNFGRVEPGIPAVTTSITFPTFTAAVTEAGASRLYAGIHFSDDNTTGQLLGNLAGQQAWDKAQSLFNGGLAVTRTSTKVASAAASLAWSHTVDTLADRLLIVGVASKGVNSVTSVSYAGLPLTRLAQQTAPAASNGVELWYRLAPPSGTATVAVTMASSKELVGGAMSVAGVHQGTPFGVARMASATGTLACITLANESAPLVASMMSTDGASSVTAGTGQTLHWVANGAIDGSASAANVVGTGMSGPGAPVATICESMPKSRNWAMVGVPLKPAR